MKLGGPGWPVLALLSSLCACGSGSPSTGAKRCDPFAVMTKPITLSPVLGVGLDGMGTIWVVDGRDGNPEHLYASSGMTLVRQVVRGTGVVGQGGGNTLLVVSSGTADAPLTVEVQLVGGKAAEMGVFRGALTTKTFTIGSMGEALELLTAGEIARFSLQNLPGTVSATYVATTDDGRVLVVTTPDVDATPADTRVFFGAPDALKERRVTVTSQPRSYAEITFDLDGQTAVARFASVFAPAITSAIEVGGQELPLTVASPATPPANASYLCL